MNFFMAVFLLSDQCRTLGIELPSIYEKLHPRKVISGSKAVLFVDLVSLLDLFDINIDTSHWYW